MTQTAIYLHIVASIFLFPALAAGQNRATELDKYFSSLARNGSFNGNVLVAENGKIVYEKSFGYADFSGKRLNTASTSFPAASITKTVVATSILQLQEKGKLNINDAYIKYFPSFPYPGVTLKQLLSHTSQLPSGAFYRYLDSVRNIAPDTFFVNSDVIPSLINMKKPLVGVGKENDRASFAYSNVNYYLLALLIEKLSGVPYAAYLKKNIFMPAGMNNTTLSEFYFGLDKNECMEHRYRYLYHDIPERVDTLSDMAYIFKTYNFKGHGDMVTTVRDLLRYDEALYNGKLVSKASLNLAYQVVVPGATETSGYGLGWSIWPDSSNGKIVQHHGGGIGIETMLVRNIGKHQTVILFDNAKNLAFYRAMDAAKIMMGEKVNTPKPSVAKLYGKTMVKEGIPAARKLLARLKNDSLHYSLSEYEMNLLAYQFMGDGKDDFAYEIFKTDLELFPGSWNVYDSYAEILLKMGRKEESIRMYQKSMELNPQNENGKMMLEKILGGK
jgi:CubicO group peptidase (beta-lactamase class C family)